VVSFFNIYCLKFDTNFSPPSALQNSHLSKYPSFKHRRETQHAVTSGGGRNWLRIIRNSGLPDRGFGSEDFEPRNYGAGAFVNENLWVSRWVIRVYNCVQVAADQWVSCQVSLPETQTLGNCSSGPFLSPQPGRAVDGGTENVDTKHQSS
jgi:hypothetical protein